MLKCKNWTYFRKFCFNCSCLFSEHCHFLLLCWFPSSFSYFLSNIGVLLFAVLMFKSYSQCMKTDTVWGNPFIKQATKWTKISMKHQSFPTESELLALGGLFPFFYFLMKKKSIFCVLNFTQKNLRISETSENANCQKFCCDQCLKIFNISQVELLTCKISLFMIFFRKLSKSVSQASKMLQCNFNDQSQDDHKGHGC